MTYRLTIDQITCLVPSSSISTDIDDAVAKTERLIQDGTTILGAAAGIGLAVTGSPEFAPVPMIDGVIVVSIVDVVASEAGLSDEWCN